MNILDKMIRLNVILVCIMVFSCSDAQKTNGESSEFGVKFDMQHVLEFSDNLEFKINDLSFFETNTINVDLDKDGANEIIKLYNVEGWEEDPGDYRKITIESKGKMIFESVNLGGWVKPVSQFNNYVIGESFMLLQASYSVIALIGYPYASDPSYLTLIAIDDTGNAKTVFNENYELIEVKKKGTGVFQLSGEESFLLIEDFEIKLQ